MKILSVTVPCYNSEAYMRHAIDSILPAGEDVEILIVDDGSTDGTAGIADEYEKKYPGIVQAIHKENGGHGDAVMCGLSHATGLYFRVLDSDDWFDSDVLQMPDNCATGFCQIRRLLQCPGAGGSLYYGFCLRQNRRHPKTCYAVCQCPAGGPRVYLGGDA